MTNRYSRVFLIVLDSVGIGELPDASVYGDLGSNTLGHIAEAVGALRLPHLEQMGLGRIGPIQSIQAVEHAKAYYGKMAELSAGKDTLTGHWEIMGVRNDVPFQTYPEGFPETFIQALESLSGRSIIGNKVASGTEILDELGLEHMQSGALIVYTSADSVLQIAAHEDIVPLAELYEICGKAREMTLNADNFVGRVIARPFIGEPGQFSRTPNRRDYAVTPPTATVMDHLVKAGYDSIGIGKISDIFAGLGVTESLKTKSNQDGVDQLIKVMQQDFNGLCFLNLVDFDAIYGHRRDPQGYAAALEEFDARLPEILEGLGSNDLLIITADHGNDPTHTGTDHTREYVPLLVSKKSLGKGSDLGIRSTFADIGATIADNFLVEPPPQGESFLSSIEEQ
ncbi:phosphopentomutase [Paenibacillus radicis (ex Xue et al. 2023)]|uniref:Phosphopentomutase n=1 Tax=Paenibacillus radicis (ex Xue et al. 2023) TaxID=2972489 RepID=A0ABT1YPM6_9BACL|nr:phosphopentomutase [Paenibacillus radicis (ex Xue et al. 2023)]MCR8635136.1 phosphopentomutase [Paenibacillus radicis (ex Xue et al. 2023)]